jgi:hypothetical protein
MTDPETRQTLIDVAESYEKLAASIEARERRWTGQNSN